MSVGMRSTFENSVSSPTEGSVPQDFYVAATRLPQVAPQDLQVSSPDQETMDQPRLPKNASTYLASFDFKDYVRHISPEKQERESFTAIQKWRGYVISVSNATFLARLTTVSGEGRDQEAEIYLKAVDPEDQDFVEPGAFFYWSIGYATVNGSQRKKSVLRFRRLPIWRDAEGELAQKEAEKVRQILSNE